MNLHVQTTINLLAISVSALLMSACDQVQSNNEIRDTKDFLVGVHRPNHLWVADVEQQKVIKHCEMPGRYGLGTVALSPDNKIAYVLGDGTESVYGINIETCELVFTAKQSQANIRVKSIGSLAISRDGSEIYTVQNPTLMLSDELVVQPPKFAVFHSNDGLNAQPIRTFEVPRTLGIMGTGKDGTVYIHGPDLVSINPATGELKPVLTGRSHQVSLATPPDGVSAWNNGNHVNEFIKAYTSVKFADETYDVSTAGIMWGYMRVDLETGEASRKEFGAYTAPIFSGATNPTDPNQYIGVLNQLLKYDVEKQALLKSVDMNHAYYQLSFSPNGKRVYLGGTLADIAIYDSETLEKLGQINLPGGGDMGMSSFQVFSKP